MSIEVTARHMKATVVLQDYARGRAEALKDEFRRVEHVHVILDIEKHRHIAEVVVQGRSHVRVEAAESSDNMRKSIDLAMERAEKQLRRVSERIRDHKVAMKQTEQKRKEG